MKRQFSYYENILRLNFISEHKGKEIKAYMWELCMQKLNLVTGNTNSSKENKLWINIVRVSLNKSKIRHQFHRLNKTMSFFDLRFIRVELTPPKWRIKISRDFTGSFWQVIWIFFLFPTIDEARQPPGCRWPVQQLAVLVLERRQAPLRQQLDR